MPRFLPLLRALLLAGTSLAALASAANAAPKTVCTITVNSPDEKEMFRRHLPPGDYRFVELVERGRKDWLASACEAKVQCDALVISGHFDGGDEFYTDRLDTTEYLSVEEMERASCSDSCPGVFANLKEVYLFGCNTLKPLPEQHVLSNRDRMREIFRNVPVIYGFSSKAPLGRYAGPLLERYLQSAPAGEVGSGKPSARLLALFAPSSMAVTSGVTDSEALAKVRSDTCRFVDDRLSTAQKVDFLHDVLQREGADARNYLEQLEHFVSAIGPAQRTERKTAAAFASVAADHAARDRYIATARATEEPAVRTRMMALARKVGWLTAAQEQAEFVRMLAERMTRDRVGREDVDLACARGPEDGSDGELKRLASGVMKSGKVTHAAALACLGSPEARTVVMRAVTSPNADDVTMAHAYLRSHPLADASEQRTLAAAIARMPASIAQVRAIEALARQRMSDPEGLREIAGLFPQARSLDVQRAIAALLIRSDHRAIGSAQLARSLKQHRIKSPDGDDVIDALIRVLQAG